jgi:hypothetical protein
LVRCVRKNCTRQKNYSYNVSGGGENTLYFLSVSDLEEKGYVMSDYEKEQRVSYGTFNPKDWLASWKFEFSDEVTSGPAQES